MTRKCIYCEETLEKSEFYLYKSVIRNGEQRFSSECKKCSRARVTAMNLKLKKEAIEYLGGSCKSCGYSKNIKALEFHHRDPKEKDFEIGSVRYKTLEDIKPELDKCDVLCANCHKEEHDLIWRNSGSYNKKLYEEILNETLREKQVRTCKTKNTFCIDCNAKIFIYATRCVKCNAASKEKISWPSDSELEILVNTNSMVALSKKLGISDRAIAGRCDDRGIKRPKRKNKSG